MRGAALRWVFLLASGGATAVGVAWAAAVMMPRHERHGTTWSRWLPWSSGWPGEVPSGWPRPEPGLNEYATGAATFRVWFWCSYEGDWGALAGTRTCEYTEQRYGWPLRCAEYVRVHEWVADGRTLDRTTCRGGWAVANPIGAWPAEVHLPWTPLWFGLVVDGVFYAGMMAGLGATARILRGDLRRRRNRCASCGYSLAGVKVNVCPECGKAVRG